MNKSKFGKLYNLFFKNLFKTVNRSNRLEYACKLLLILSIIFLPFIIIFTSNIISFFLPTVRLDIIFTNHIITILILILFPFLMIQILFASYRRLHDLNKSGWWLLIIITPLIPLLILALIFIKGTSGSNKYGEEPTY